MEDRREAANIEVLEVNHGPFLSWNGKVIDVERVIEQGEEGIFFNAYDQNQVVGSLFMEDASLYGGEYEGEMNIESLYVVFPYRSKGVLMKLVTAAREWAATHGYKLTALHISNDKLNNLYEKYEDRLNVESKEAAVTVEVAGPNEAYYNHRGLQFLPEADDNRLMINAYDGNELVGSLILKSWLESKKLYILSAYVDENHRSTSVFLALLAKAREMAQELGATLTPGQVINPKLRELLDKYQNRLNASVKESGVSIHVNSFENRQDEHYLSWEGIVEDLNFYFTRYTPNVNRYDFIINAWDSEELAGTLILGDVGRSLDIEQMFVLPNHRKGGVALALLRAAKGIATDDERDLSADMIENEHLKELMYNPKVVDRLLHLGAGEITVHEIGVDEETLDIMGELTSWYPFEGYKGWNAYDGDKLIGSLRARLGWGYEDTQGVQITGAFVKPEYRNTQAFLLLASKALEWAQELGMGMIDPSFINRKLEQLWHRFLGPRYKQSSEITIRKEAPRADWLDYEGNLLEYSKGGMGVRNTLFNAYDENELAGSVLLIEDEKGIGVEQVYVKPEYRQTNAALKLFQAAREYILRTGKPLEDPQFQNPRLEQIYQRWLDRTSATEITVREATEDDEWLFYTGEPATYPPSAGFGPRGGAKVFNAYDGNKLVGSLQAIGSTLSGIVRVQQVYVIPSYRKSSAFVKLVQAYKQYVASLGEVRELRPDFENKDLARVYDRYMERLDLDPYVVR